MKLIDILNEIHIGKGKKLLVRAHKTDNIIESAEVMIKGYYITFYLKPEKDTWYWPIMLGDEWEETKYERVKIWLKEQGVPFEITHPAPEMLDMLWVKSIFFDFNNKENTK